MELANTSSISDAKLEESKDIDMQGDGSDKNVLRKSMHMSPSKSQVEKTRGEGGLIAETFYGELVSFINYKDPNENAKF